MTVQEEVRERLARDAQLVRLRKKIESGKATYEDTAAYSVRAGKLLGEVFSRRLPEIPPEEREQLCVDLLHDQYIDINAAVDTVQRFMDEAQGFQLAPQHAPFDAERGHQIGSSLRDLSKPVEVLQRRAKAAPETMTKAMHDDRMKTEAKFRSRAGLKCTVNRIAAAKCCEWCDQVAGKYAYEDTPPDLWRRHDNCNCTIVYSTRRDRQVLRGTEKKWEIVAEGVGAPEPVRLTPEQARKLQEKHQLKRLTKSAESGKMFTRAAYPNRRIRSDGNQVVDKATYQKLTRDFIRRGGIIRNDEEAVRILEAQHVHAAYLPSLWSIAFSPEPTISEVLEETYHAEQDRKHMFGAELTDEVILRREIDAQHYLLSLTERYKIPEAEVELTKFNLANYERDLEKLLQSQGGGESG